jgi:peptide/nickel transport system ATP-binding protein
MAEPVCEADIPPLAPLGEGHLAACLMAVPGSGHSRADKVAA